MGRAPVLLVVVAVGCGRLDARSQGARETAASATAASATAASATGCPDATVEGVDVFSGNGTIDWSQVAQSGRQFAFIKATQGNYDMDSEFATYWAQAQAAGILRSPYHFFDATIDGSAQANYFLAQIGSAGGLLDTDLAPMLDLECPTSSDESSADPCCEYAGESGWVDTDTLIQRTYDWLDTVEQATGRTPIIYSYVSWFASTMFTDARLASYPLYVASYTTCPAVPAPWTTAEFWQYSATGTVSGIGAGVDLDRFIGSSGALEAQTGQTAPTDAGIGGGGGAADAGRGSLETLSGGCHAGGSLPGGLVVIGLAAWICRGARRRSRRSRAASAPERRS